MASYDKGRRKWGDIAQDNMPNNRYEQERLAAARAGTSSGGSKAPPRALYRPGSGPLRKSGRSDDYENESNPQDRPRTSVQDRLKPAHFNNPPKNNSRLHSMNDIAHKFNDIQINCRNHIDEHNQTTPKNNHTSNNDPRKKSKKPEQALYVPKKVKEAMADQDITSRLPQNNWDKDNERIDSREWSSQHNRSQRNEIIPNRNFSNNFSSSHNHNVTHDNQAGRPQKEEHSKRFVGNRRNRNAPESVDHRRSGSPPPNRNFSNHFREDPREMRQGSEHQYMPIKASNESNWMRDTHMHQDKFQNKPPIGKRVGKEITMSKNLKLEALPPRLKIKYIEEHGPPVPEGSWDGSTVTFQGSVPMHPSTHHPHRMQNLPPSALLPPQNNWSNTIPARGRGRGRFRMEDSEMSPPLRPGTPDQFSAPSSRSHTPSQEYSTRAYDRRGSNSTYNSTESLNRDSLLMPPPSKTPGSFRTANSYRSQSPVDNYSKREIKPSFSSQRSPHQIHKVNNNYNESDAGQEISKVQESPSTVAVKSGSSSTAPDENVEILDWYEEVKMSEKLEADRLSRSSSVTSLHENPNSSLNQSGSGRSGRRSSKKKKSKNRGRDKSKDKVEDRSKERQTNQLNRENDNFNNNKKNNNSSSNGSSNKRFEKRRNTSHRSRESSKERNYRGGSRGSDDFCRNRTSQHIEENWRTGRTSVCDSDDGRRTPLSYSTSTTNSGPSSLHRLSPTAYSNSQHPGVLILPEQTNLSLTASSSKPLQQQIQPQKRTLFDPNNPNKPIYVTSSGNRGGSQNRDNEVSVQPANVPGYQSHGNMQPIVQQSFHSTLMNNTCMPLVPADQITNTRPSWYDPYSDSFRSARNPVLLLDIERADLELQYLYSSGSLLDSWAQISQVRSFHHKSLETLLVTDMKFCQAENVEQHFWKIVYYNIIEILRKPVPKEDNELQAQHKKLLLNIVDEGTAYFTSLLTCLENTYKFKIDTFLSACMVPPKGLGMIGLALVSTQKIFLFLGDLARYKELANESSNYGKSRQWYLKAQQINPKNGRPYSQLALLATYARRKLDAVYYYMRSLMASNPFPSARESLITMFDENRKKYESMERKRKEERELKERARMKEKEGANLVGGGLRREVWFHPDGKRVRRTTSAASEAKETNDSDLEDLEQLTSVELNKRFVTSYLHVHGKLITRIGMETFQEAAIQMLREFRTLLHHSPLPLPISRLLQLLALNMFAIDTTQLKDSRMEQDCRSEVQERALVVSLQMFSLILERGVGLLKAQLESSEHPRLIVGEDMQILLAAIKIWCDWMLCHSTVWNPPPSCTDYRVGPPGDAWSRLATMVNLLDKLEYSRDLLIRAKDAEERADEVKLIKLPEDTTLAGFTPLMSNPQDPFFVDKKEDMEVVQVCLRIHKILFFGQEFLCGLETPVLKLLKSETGESEYVSVVETSSSSTPSSPPEQSDSELMVESYSEDEGDSSLTSSRMSSEDTGYNSVTSSSTAPPGEIRSLIKRKEELEKRQRRQDRHRQRVQAILQKSSLSVEIEVRPKQLVPDTNCFIDYLPQLQSIAKATSGTLPIYTLMVPLVVLNELEGLSRGADVRDCGPTSRAALNPEHVARVAENAKAGLAFARSKNPAIRCLTTRGTVLTSSSFTVEEDVSQDGVTRNDDRILSTCLSLCKPTKDQIIEEGQPRRVKRDVVLLTEDRNLRVKALARDVPVREVPDFIQWAGLG